jgi:predicted Zn-dependent protease
MLHEMGHALGIWGHSPDPGDTMYARVTHETPQLSDRDRNTLRKLYARPIGSRVAGARGRKS